MSGCGPGKCTCGAVENDVPAVPLSKLLAGPGRPSWDNYFMEMANTVSTRATCPRRSVGAVIVKDKRVLSTGYNGSPPGHPHCIDVGCQMVDDHCVRVIHAEANAILQGAKYGTSLDGAICYCNTLPCYPCAKMLLAAGIHVVVYDADYRPDPLVAGLEMDFLKI